MNRFCTPWGVDCGDISMGRQIVGRAFGPDDASPEQLRAIRDLTVGAPRITAALLLMLQATKHLDGHFDVRAARREALLALADAKIEPSHSARIELLGGEPL